MFQFNLSRFVHFLRNSRSKVDGHSELQKGFAVFRQVPAVFSCSPFALSTKKEFILSWANCSFYFHFLFFHVRNLLPSPFMPWEKKLRLQTPLFFYNHWRCIYNFWLLRLTLPYELFAMIRHENIRILWPYFREQGVFLLETRPTRISNVN